MSLTETVPLTDELVKALSDALRSPVTFERLDEAVQARAKEHDEAYRHYATLALTDETGEMRNKAFIRLGRLRECETLIQVFKQMST